MTATCANDCREDPITKPEFSLDAPQPSKIVSSYLLILVPIKAKHICLSGFLRPV